jgi:hypothetical protein
MHKLTLYIFFLCSLAMIKYGVPHGGPGGVPFDDANDLKLLATAYCIGAELFWQPDYLAAIRFIYQQDQIVVSKVHGGYGDPYKLVSSLLNETFIMDDGERINKVTRYQGTSNFVYPDGSRIEHVLGIQFHTTAGRTSRLYGSNIGERYNESHTGYTLGFAKGRSGFLIDMLQFAWYKQG